MHGSTNVENKCELIQSNWYKLNLYRIKMSIFLKSIIYMFNLP